MPRMLNRLSKLSVSELRGIILVILGVLALGFYYSWWFQEGRLTSPWLVLGFVVAVSYGGIQILSSWLVYLATHHRQVDTPLLAVELTVDVFVTACGEEYGLVERALAAACAMRGNHGTWLLDDGQDPALAALAEKLGASYLTRQDRKNAKAGNINAALTRTDGEIIVIFDIDHAPKVEFLEQCLAFFADPKIGFVQVMLTFENDGDGWVAQAAGESSYDFYNPISIGADGVKSATLVGTNALIRRKALESVGGYQPGLAEDLETSIALHAAGWRSAYVREPLAPGLAPPDLVAWFTQQFKWARGVFETLLTAYPRYFSRLEVGQRLFYPVRMSYYWLGSVVCIHIFVTLIALLGGSNDFRAGFYQYLTHLLPLSIMTLIIRLLALRRWSHEALQRNMQWKPIALVFVTWPIYTIAWLMALLRLPLAFRPTPKTRAGGLNPLWLTPQLITSLLLLIGLYNVLVIEDEVHYLLISGFAISQAVIQLLLIGRVLYGVIIETLAKAIKIDYALNSQVSGLPARSDSISRNSESSRL
jgi:cellulose synthase (UDP-forming)